MGLHCLSVPELVGLQDGDGKEVRLCGLNSGVAWSEAAPVSGPWSDEEVAVAAVVVMAADLQGERLGPPGAVPWANPRPPLGGPHLPPLQHHWNQSEKQGKCLNKGHNKMAVKFICEEVVSSILIGGNINSRKQPQNMVTMQYTYTPPPAKSPVPLVRLGRWRDLI